MLHPALFVSPKCAAAWPVAVLMFCSEIRESLNWEDKASVSCAAQSSVNL